MQLIEDQYKLLRPGDGSSSSAGITSATRYLWDFIRDFCEEDEGPSSSGKSFCVAASKDVQEFQLKGVKINSESEKAVLVIFEDQAFVRKLKDELTSARHTTMLIASTSHELRTPLCGIINALELMKGTLNKDMEQYHEIALSSSKNLLSTVNDVLVTFNY